MTLFDEIKEILAKLPQPEREEAEELIVKLVREAQSDSYHEGWLDAYDEF